MTTEEKQNFLREKILDKGYDTNQFVQFLTEKKERMVPMYQIGQWKI